MYATTLRLATWLSLAAVVFAVVADLASVSHDVIVLTVIGAGFAASWRASGRAVGTQPTATGVTVSAAPRAW